ncbi:2-phospho-L-lactate guanylyltransferase [Isoptericola sp. NPDC055881]
MTAPSTGQGGAVAVVPLRDGVSGKSRLAAALDPAARRRLVAALARHVVAVLRASAGVDGVLVVTADAVFARETLGLPDQGGSSGSERQLRLPRGTGTAAPVAPDVEVVAQPPDRPGLNAALDVGRETAVERGAARLLVAHADLPLLAPDDVEALLAAAADGATGVVATDRHLAGTNLLALPADVPFTFRFGEGSRAAHVEEAARAGLRPVVVRRTGTAVDLDTVDDWSELPRAVRDRLRRGLDLPLP